MGGAEKRQAGTAGGVVAVLLVVYGNATAYLVEYSQLAIPGNLLLPNLLSVTILLLWARRGARLSFGDLGLHWRGAIGSGVWGAVSGLLVATPAALALAFPLLPVSVTYPQLGGLGPLQPTCTPSSILTELDIYAKFVLGGKCGYGSATVHLRRGASGW